MSIRARFAPSPTGQVHIGNIRVAIFNWLFARHENGRFLLRIEDTDRERCTPEAIATLLDSMHWLGLDYDEEALYQSTQFDRQHALAEWLLEQGYAYRSGEESQGTAIVFRIPWEARSYDCVHYSEQVDVQLHADEPLVIDATGVNYAHISRKGKPVKEKSCLVGMADLAVYDTDGGCLFYMPDAIDEILEGGKSFSFDNAARLSFSRHNVSYNDIIKGTLSKPLDSLKDMVIVRSDGSPVFHLANVSDDITQEITHIIRGDDHVENTYRHILLYKALQYDPPRYAHLPMIVNAQGKPYSKRDGDAFVGDFRSKGYLPEALFNYLSLLGWSPGDDREKMSRGELVEAFTLDRVQHTPAQVDLRKLEHLNGQYIAELNVQDFVSQAREFADEQPWGDNIDEKQFQRVAELMQTRTKKLVDVESWAHFFRDIPEYDQQACRKMLTNAETRQALSRVREKFQTISFEEGEIEQAIHAATEEVGIKQGKLNQPLRVAVTGRTVGAGIYETLAVLGREAACRRLDYAINNLCGEDDDE